MSVMALGMNIKLRVMYIAHSLLHFRTYCRLSVVYTSNKCHLQRL